LELSGYCDSDWANLEDRKSVTGYCFSLGSDFVCWKTRKQPCVALSTCEAEYVALATATQEAKFLKQLLEDMTCCKSKPVQIGVDNRSAISLAKNPVHHNRSKHIDIKYHFVRLEVQNESVKLEYTASEDNVADMFTKPLCHKRLVYLLSK
jgi:hypothetical protein